MSRETRKGDPMPWTLFWDMHSGGGTKEPPYEAIYIEAPESEARVIFYNRFGHNPERVTCTCCGEDYSISEGVSLAAISGFHRGCQALETPRNPETMSYETPDDPWFDEHYYLEPGEEEEAKRRGYKISSFGSWNSYKTLDEYLALPDVLVVRAEDIKPEERVGNVPAQGYVWMG